MSEVLRWFVRNIHNSLISPGQQNNCQDSIIIDTIINTIRRERELKKKKKEKEESIFHSLDFIAIST